MEMDMFLDIYDSLLCFSFKIRVLLFISYTIMLSLSSEAEICSNDLM